MSGAETRAVLPSPGELARALASDLEWIAERLGSEVAGFASVSPLRATDRPRTAFRVELADGRRVKLRRMKTAERAEELARLLERLRAQGLPRPLLRRDASLVIEWIEGSPFPGPPSVPDALERAARLLASLHALASFDGEALPVPHPVRSELGLFDEQLGVLVAARRLDRAEASALMALARERAPERALRGIAHGDFTAENLVVDPAGRLRVVDNEALHVGFLDVDLARVWSRWPMPAASWHHFLAAYALASGREVGDSDLAVWKLRTLVLSAWYRIRYELPGVDEGLARLRDLHASLVGTASRPL